MKKVIIISVLIFSLFFIQAVITGQEGTFDYTYGVVVKKILSGESKIIIIEYDYNQNKEVEIEYYLDKELELNNVTSLDEINPGDNLEIDFLVENGKRIAKIITLEKNILEENNNGETVPTTTQNPE